MNSHLLTISVGPVQEFISAARRTRDLWFGSILLSEISRAAAKAIAQNQGNLIFPANIHTPSVANIVLAEVVDTDVGQVAAAAKNAARGYWITVAEEVRSRIDKEFANSIRDKTWKNQVDDIIEIYAAWVPRTHDYQADRRHLNKLMAGRKNARDFERAHGEAGVPKSSLDGQRESVLTEQISRQTRTQLRLTDGEQLDVVGLVKRHGFGTRHYPSVARIAADAWLQRAKLRGELLKLREACEKLDGLHRVQEAVYADFPFEGTVIYKDRHANLTAELGLGPSDLKRVAELVKGTPTPYLAVLVADGDRMGEELGKIKDPETHRKSSAKLADFAVTAESEVTKHRGVLVYAGGDDVLAFLPVDKSIHCAFALRTKLHELTKMTLSVGIGIGHFMENLEDLLDYGRTAEKAAKAFKGKDALAVHVHKRGGAPVRVAAPWRDAPHDRLQSMASLIAEKKLSGRVAYDLQQMADLYRGWQEPKEAIQRDVKRMLAAKKPEGGDTGTKEIQALIERRVTDSVTLETFAQELLIARLLAEVQQQAEGKGGSA